MHMSKCVSLGTWLKGVFKSQAIEVNGLGQFHMEVTV